MAHLNLLSPSNFSNSDTDFGFPSIQHLHLKNILLLQENIVLYFTSLFLSASVLILAPKSGKMAFLVTLHFPANSFSLPLSLPKEADLDRVLFTFWLLVGFSQWKDRRWKGKKREPLWVFIPLVLSLLWWICSRGCVLQLECPLSQIGATLFPSLFLQSWGWWRLPAVHDSWAPQHPLLVYLTLPSFLS